MNETLREALREAALEAYREHRTLADPMSRGTLCEAFLRNWLIKTDSPLVMDPTAASGSYFFLFWKNLSVTNTSVVELMALLRQFVRDRDKNDEVQVDFIATDHYKAFLNNLWESLFPRQPGTESAFIANAATEKTASASPPSKNSEVSARISPDDAINQTVDRIIEFHGAFFQRTIIFDTYFTSVLVHIPLSLKVDIGSITIRSGYVHSSGLALYFRNIEKAETSGFETRLEKFLALRNKKLFVTPYAWEFFGPFEDESATSIRNGLDGVRIHLEKHHFGNQFFLNFLAILQNDFPDSVYIPPGVKTYTEEREEARSDKKCADDCTIWFVTDSGFSFDRAGVTSKNKMMYLIAYAQSHLNFNQLNIFKERKPGWLASTTLPHTLSAAMVNIARHQWRLNRTERSERKDAPVRETPVIIDPFCGTGTTLFDALLRFDSSAIIGLDREPLMPALVRMNLELMTLPHGHVDEIHSDLRSIHNWLENFLNQNRPAGLLKEARKQTTPPTKHVPASSFAYCLNLLLIELQSGDEISDLSVKRTESAGFSHSVVDRLDAPDFPFDLKLYFYLQWRALRRNTFSFRSEARSPTMILRILMAEVQQSVHEFHALLRLLTREVVRDRSPFQERIGLYSTEGAIHPEFFRHSDAQPTVVAEDDISKQLVGGLRPGLTLSRVTDSIQLLQRLGGTADIIITDPPFGFNAFEANIGDMQSLYARMIPTLVDALKPWGQLLLSLPAYAKNGKQIPFYQTRESVIKQIIATVESKGRKIVRSVETVPGAREMFQPPWYWGTASTIERRVVHFVVK